MMSLGHLRRELVLDHFQKFREYHSFHWLVPRGASRYLYPHATLASHCITFRGKGGYCGRTSFSRKWEPGVSAQDHGEIVQLRSRALVETRGAGHRGQAIAVTQPLGPLLVCGGAVSEVAAHQSSSIGLSINRHESVLAACFSGAVSAPMLRSAGPRPRALPEGNSPGA